MPKRFEYVNETIRNANTRRRGIAIILSRIAHSGNSLIGYA